MRRLTLSDSPVRVGLVSGATVLLLYAIALITAHEIDVEQLSPSTPRKAIELNKRNDGVVHSGPGEPVLGRMYRAGAAER